MVDLMIVGAIEDLVLKEKKKKQPKEQEEERGKEETGSGWQ